MTDNGIDRAPRWHFRAAVAGALLLVVGAYANHFHNVFHFDDSHVIEDNLAIRSLANAPRFFSDATTFSTLTDHQTYRPLLPLTFAVDYRLGGGLDPLAFHVSQFLFHLMVGLGIFLLVRKAAAASVPGSANRYFALLAATWFCLHTANTETVNYLSSRSDILSTLGILASFAVYLHAPRWRGTYLYLVPMVLGALAKPPAVVFAPLLLVWILLFEEELPLDQVTRPEAGAKVWAALLRTMPAVVVAVAVFLFVEGMTPEAQTYGGGDRIDYLRTQAWVWLHYLRLFVLPVGLTADTDWTIIPSWTDTRVAVGIGGLALLAWVGVRASKVREWRPVAFGLIWFVVGLLPSSSVFPLAEVANEHRIYLPYVGLVLAAAWTARLRAVGTDGLARSWRGWAVAGVVMVAGHLVGTSVRNRVWLNEETLWADVVVKSPGNGRAWMNYGVTQMEQGRFEEARDLFVTARERWPAYAPIYVNLGVATHRLGDTPGADAYFLRGLDLRPGYANGLYLYGRFLTQVGRGPEALLRLRESVASAANYAAPRYLLLDLYYLLGSRVEVETLARETLSFFPEDENARAYLEGSAPVAGIVSTAYDRGVELTAEGRHLEAGIAYRRHLDEVGTDADALLNLGWSLASVGFDAVAAIAFQQVLVLRPDDALARNNLAWVQERMRAAGITAP